MRATARLGAMQARAQTLMIDTFAAYALTFEEVDGFREEVWTPQGTTSGKVAGRSRQSDTDTRTVTIGGVEREVVDGGLHIPLGPMRPQIDWEFVCTDVGPASDSSLLGRRWRVVDVPAKSYMTARRLDVVEVSQ